MFWFGRQVTLCLEEVERGKACLASRCLCSLNIIDMKVVHIGAHYWLVFFFSQIIEIYSKKFNPPCKSTRPEIYPEFKMHLSTLTRRLNAQKYGIYLVMTARRAEGMKDVSQRGQSSCSLWLYNIPFLWHLATIFSLSNVKTALRKPPTET